MKVNLALLSILMFFACYSNAQINKVLNPSFEDYSDCPFIQNQIFYANYWNGFDTLVDFNDNCKSDYYNTCSPNFSPDSNMFFRQSPKTGNALIMSLFYFYEQATNTEGRDYARGKLSSKLLANTTYCSKFYVNLLPLSFYAVNKIGAYIDDGNLDTNYACSELDFVNAQIITNSIITDTLNWTKIENTFVANGTEKYITLGCFKNHNNLQTLVTNAQALFEASYYLIDDVSIIDISTPAFAGTDALIASGDSVYLGRPNEIGPECRWWANGTALNDSSLGFWAKPSQPTQYVLQQKICGNVKYDTVFVNISGHDGLSNPIGNKDAFKLLPNPNNGSFIISSSQATYNNVIIYSIDGKEVYNNKLVFTKGNANFDLDLPNGVYHVKLIGSSGVASQKLIISK